jgi:hypothetical protein
VPQLAQNQRQVVLLVGVHHAHAAQLARGAVRDVRAGLATLDAHVITTPEIVAVQALSNVARPLMKSPVVMTVERLSVAVSPAARARPSIMRLGSPPVEALGTTERLTARSVPAVLQSKYDLLDDPGGAGRHGRREQAGGAW